MADEGLARLDIPMGAVKDTPDWLPLRGSSTMGEARVALGLAKRYRTFCKIQELLRVILPGDVIEIVDPTNEPFYMPENVGWALTP